MECNKKKVFVVIVGSIYQLPTPPIQNNPKTNNIWNINYIYVTTIMETFLLLNSREHLMQISIEFEITELKTNQIVTGGIKRKEYPRFNTLTRCFKEDHWNNKSEYW